MSKKARVARNVLHIRGEGELKFDTLRGSTFESKLETLCVLSCKRTIHLRLMPDLQKVQERDGWIWRLHGTMNGMRTASRDFTEFLAGVLKEDIGFKRGKLERCLFVRESNETSVVSHLDDPLICAKPSIFEKFWTQITKLVVIKRGEALNLDIPVVYQGFEHQSVHEAGCRGFTVKPTDKYLDECLDILQLRNAKAVMLKSTNLHDGTTVCGQDQHT